MANASFVEFVASSRARIDRATSLVIVMGNESADLDSMASSLSYAYLASQSLTDETDAAVAVMNIPRADFKLRTEAVWMFRAVGIDERQLLFLDEIDIAQTARRTRMRLVLVDHNQLAPSQQSLASLVDEIIDHHPDAGAYPQVRSKEIVAVGSTATLISERIHAASPSTLKSSLAMLLLGTILLDTVNLDVKRTHDRDRSAVNRLRPLVETSPAVLFEKLELAKFSVGSLTTNDLLRKDYKASQAGGLRFAISSVPISTAAWVARDDKLRNEFASFTASRRLDAILTMQFFNEPEFARQLGVYSADPAVRKRLIDALSSTEIQLTPLTVIPPNDRDAIEFFRQGNLKIARKNVQLNLEGLLGRQ